MNLGKEVINIKISNIIPNRFQPRISFDEEALTELTNSIKVHGILQPLIVRQIGDKYEIIAGERRYKAAIRAGLNEVPAIVVNFDDQTSAELALIENIQRKDLTALEEAKSYKKLLDMSNITQEQLALKLGKKQSTIANKIRLLNLIPEAQDALMNNAISERHARSLLQIKNNDEKQKEVLRRIIEERLTVKETDELIKRLLNVEPTYNNNVDTVQNSNPITNNYGGGLNNTGTNSFNANSFSNANSFTSNIGTNTPTNIMNDTININELSSPNMVTPTVPVQPYSNVANYGKVQEDDMEDLISSKQPEPKNMFPDYDSLLKKEETTVPVSENVAVKPVVMPTIGKFPTERDIEYKSLEDQSANFNFDKPFTTPKTNANVVPIDPNHITEQDKMNFINFNNPTTEVKSAPIPTPTPVVPNLSSSTNASTTLNSSTTQPTVSIPSSSTISLNINSNETKPNANLSSAISKTKEFSEGLKRDGVNVIIEELDMTDEYRIVFRIKKQAS